MHRRSTLDDVLHVLSMPLSSRTALAAITGAIAHSQDLAIKACVACHPAVCTAAHSWQQLCFGHSDSPVGMLVAFKGFSTYAEARNFASAQLGVAQQPMKTQKPANAAKATQRAQYPLGSTNESTGNHSGSRSEHCGGNEVSSSTAAGFVEVVCTSYV